jgi:hypothetical protein
MRVHSALGWEGGFTPALQIANLDIPITNHYDAALYKPNRPVT